MSIEGSRRMEEEREGEGERGKRKRKSGQSMTVTGRRIFTFEMDEER